MTEGGPERGGALTPEQHEEPASTGAVALSEERAREDRDRGSAGVERELTDDELRDIWESTTTGVRDGSIPTFDETNALIQDVLRRLGR